MNCTSTSRCIKKLIAYEKCIKLEEDPDKDSDKMDETNTLQQTNWSCRCKGSHHAVGKDPNLLVFQELQRHKSVMHSSPNPELRGIQLVSKLK